MGSNTPPVHPVARLRRRWRARVAADNYLSRNAQRVALAVDDADGRLDVPAVAAALDLSRGDVGRALDELKAADWINVQRGGYVFRVYTRGARRTHNADHRAGRPFNANHNR